jgi:hypothetical protein
VRRDVVTTLEVETDRLTATSTFPYLEGKLGKFLFVAVCFNTQSPVFLASRGRSHGAIKKQHILFMANTTNEFHMRNIIPCNKFGNEYFICKVCKAYRQKYHIIGELYIIC